MSEPIVYIDKSHVCEGKLEELKTAMRELVDFIESSASQAISYRMYLNEAGDRMTVVQIHPDSESLEIHMQVGAPAFAKFKDLIRLSNIEVYGEPSDLLRQLLSDKARMLGNATVTVHRKEAGFSRLSPL